MTAPERPHEGTEASGRDDVPMDPVSRRIRQEQRQERAIKDQRKLGEFGR
jgi:hypothetical protein